jgi:hypothetical protein
MGYFRRKTVTAICSNYDDKVKLARLDSFITKNPKLFTKLDSLANGYITYVMAWDGSKEGWDTSDDADKLRSRFIKLLKDLDADIYHVIQGKCEDASILTHKENCNCYICEPEIEVTS